LCTIATGVRASGQIFRSADGVQLCTHIATALADDPLVDPTASTKPWTLHCGRFHVINLDGVKIDGQSASGPSSTDRHYVGRKHEGKPLPRIPMGAAQYANWNQPTSPTMGHRRRSISIWASWREQSSAWSIVKRRWCSAAARHCFAWVPASDIANAMSARPATLSTSPTSG
jgi:hypothetical protein